MVADWWQSFARGEDAVMVAKRNAEVAELNEHARAAMKEAGRLKGEEIAVGEARFAAGDQVITRVNDHQAAIYNRERWEVAEVNAAERTVTLRGIDQERTVQVNAAFLARTNRDAPALQHASRAREETQIYATPEVQGERDEFAPRSEYLRDGIPHIAEVAERDRAQGLRLVDSLGQPTSTVQQTAPVVWSPPAGEVPCWTWRKPPSSPSRR
jgi:hypothetical protein